MTRLTDKIALVTGGSSGIGFATAQALLDEGARIFITGRRADLVEDAARRLGGGATPVPGDVTSSSDLAALFERIGNEAGRLDIVVANAGRSEFVPLAEVKEDHYDRMFDTNVKAAIFTVTNALPLLSEGASIILVSAIGATKAVANFSVYSAAKGALISFARCAAVDLKDRRIRVNVLSPGVIPTEAYSEFGMTDEAVAAFTAKLTADIPAGRPGSPEEVAKAALFLASSDSSYVNGIELVVDGGYLQV